MISSSFLEKIRLHIYEPVSLLSIKLSVVTFQVLIHLSAVPDPVARMPLLRGHHAKAFTAAKWFFFIIGTSILGEYRYNLLSFPPDAKYLPSGDHFMPQTSYLWLGYNLMKLFGILKSYIYIQLSLEPVKSIFSWIDKAPTLSIWSSI